MPSGFDGIARSKVGMHLFFPWGVLASTALLGGGLVMERLQPESGVSWGFASAERPSLSILGVGMGHVVLTVNPESKILSWLLSFSFAHCPQHWHFCLVENSAGARGPGRRLRRLWEVLRQSRKVWPEPQLAFSPRPQHCPWDKQARMCVLSTGGVLLSCCCSVAQSCLCDPMNRSTPGFPVLHHLPEFTQAHVSDAIQPSHPSLPTSPALNLSQH